MADYALVLNAGSSSLKFSVYSRSNDQDWRLSSRGQIEDIETSPRIAVKDFDGKVLIDRRIVGPAEPLATMRLARART
jgi:acetate kinase